MKWSDLEASFLRAFRMSFSKKKWAITSLVLFFWGAIFSLFEAFSFRSHPWISLSSLFFGLFLGFFLLGNLAIFLTKSYLYELKKEPFQYKALVWRSFENFSRAISLFFPSFLSSFVLSLALGLGFLFREIPWLGPFFSVLLSPVSFILVTLQTALLIGTAFLLFWSAPLLSFQRMRLTALFERVSLQFKERPLTALGLFVFSILPALFSCLFLLFPLQWTYAHFAACESSLSAACVFLFFSFTLAPLLAPSLIFFFHFALESHVHLHPKKEFSKAGAPL